VVENIKCILAPGGVAIITLPNSISLPSILTFLYYKIRNKEMDKIMEQHLNYPFYKSVRIFRDDNFRLIETSGTNLIFKNSPFLRLLYKTPIFATVNKINFYLSILWPLKYFSQFFFIVIKNEQI